MLNVADIESTACRIAHYVHTTPLASSSSLGSMVGSEVYFKCENLQKTGSFKVRGAFNTLLSLTDDEKARGVVCYSSGNHAQAVAYASSVLGIRSQLFMPENAIAAKVNACKAYGGSITSYGKTGSEAHAKALEYMQTSNSTYIDPVEDPRIMAGQGTIGLEILQDLPGVDTIYVPVGGGGLISEISAAIKALSSKTTVIGVEPEHMNCMGASFSAGRITTIPSRYSIADGLAGTAPGEKAFAEVMDNVDEMVTVSDEEIATALTLIVTYTKMLIEPSAAVSFAGLLLKKTSGKNVCILSGGNANLHVIADIFSQHTEV